MTPERLTAYVRILTRDLLPSVMAGYLVFAKGWPSELWHPPVLGGLLGITLLAPRTKGLPPMKGDE